MAIYTLIIAKIYYLLNKKSKKTELTRLYLIQDILYLINFSLFKIFNH